MPHIAITFPDDSLEVYLFGILAPFVTLASSKHSIDSKINLNWQWLSEWACVSHVYRPLVYTVGLQVDWIQLSSYNLITSLWIQLQRDTHPTLLMLGQRLRRWPNIEPTLEKCTIFEGKSSCPANTTHLYNIGPTSSTLAKHCIKSYKCFVFTGCQFKCGSARFEIPAVIQSMCLQINDQLRARAKGFGNYYLIDVAQVYMNFENLLLMRLWVWNTYLVLL